MAFKNIIRWLTEPADPSTTGTDGDNGLWLSLHTGTPVSAANELDPARESGYARTRCRAVEWTVASSLSSLATEQVLLLGGSNNQAWPTPFHNRGSTAWRPATVAALNVGQQARVARNSVSFPVAEVTLGQAFTLAAGGQGLPSSNLYQFGLDMPHATTDIGGFFPAEVVTTTPVLFANLLYDLTFHRFAYHTSVAADFPRAIDNGGRYGNRVAEGLRGISLLALPLSFWNMTPGLVFGQNPSHSTTNIPGFPGNRSAAASWPVMVASADKQSLINREDLFLGVTSPVAANLAGFWSLDYHSTGLGWRARAPWLGFPATGPVASREASLLPMLYGTLDSARNPSLGVGQGVIPAGALSIRIAEST